MLPPGPPGNLPGTSTPFRPSHPAPAIRRIRRSVLGGVLLLLGPPAAAAQTERDAGPGPLLVLAPASLAEALPAVVRGWEAAGGTPVRLSLGATSRLAPLALQGGADLLITADAEWMGWVVERAGAAAADVVPLLRTGLAVVVPARGGAAPPRTLRDLAAVRRLALAGESVPAGRYARAALEAAGVWDAVADRVVRGESVRGALEWVARGEADAGVVYRTDVAVHPGVRLAFVVPAGEGPDVVYPAAVLSGARHRAEAEAFLAYLRSPAASAQLVAAGFELPVQDPAGPGAAAASAGPPGLPDGRAAVVLSLVVALAATALGLVPAVALGRLLARHDFPGKTLVTTLVLVPLVLPPVVTGFILLALLGSRGVLGPALATLGLAVPFTPLAPVIAAVVVGLPLYVLSARGAFEAVDPRLEELSWTLGVRPRPTFRRVALPLALPGIAAGAVLAFARALGEFGATIVLAGNVEGRTRTIPLAVYSLLETPGGGSAVWLLAGASVALSILALVGFEALSSWQRRRLQDRAWR